MLGTSTDLAERGAQCRMGISSRLLSVRASVRSHGWTVLTVLALNVLGGAIFLSSTASGTNSAWVGVPFDDSWIHFVYARNLAEDLRFYYNDGVMESGMINPL